LHLFLIIFCLCCTATFLYIFVALQHFLYFCALQHFFAPFILSLLLLASLHMKTTERLYEVYGGRRERGLRSSWVPDSRGSLFPPFPPFSVDLCTPFLRLLRVQILCIFARESPQISPSHFW